MHLLFVQLQLFFLIGWWARVDTRAREIYP